ECLCGSLPPTGFLAMSITFRHVLRAGSMHETQRRGHAVSMIIIITTIYLLMIYKVIYLSNNYSKRVVKVSVVKRNKRCNIKWLYKQTTTTTTIIIQNRRVSQIQSLSKSNDQSNALPTAL